MPAEVEVRGTSSGALGGPTHRASWIARNERFIRTLCMLGTYVFGAILLISILVVGAFAFITGALAGVFVVTLAILLALSTLRRRRPR